jgi:hypothetical protein
MKKLLSLVNQLSTYIPVSEQVNSAISEVSIGWHIEHACLVIIKITETIKQSNPDQFNPRFSFMKLVVFITGKFPRGKAKAPAAVMPVEQLTSSQLLESIANAKKAIEELNNCAKNQFFTHPIFGNLNKTQTFPFLGIHTNHHIRIIQDIAA